MPIKAVVDAADFSPAHDGEQFFTITFRVPADTKVVAGVYDLVPLGPGTPEWAKSIKDDQA